MHVVVTSFFTDISATLIYKSYGPVLTKVRDRQGLKETVSQNFIWFYFSVLKITHLQ